jgi:hypothetical protein
MPRPDRPGLKTVCVKIPEAYYEAVRLLVERGLYANFSEAVRAGLALLIRRNAELAALVEIVKEQDRILKEKEAVLSALDKGGARA